MKNLAWFILAGGSIGLAFWAHSPYMAFCLYAFFLLLCLAQLSTRAWLSGLECTRSISHAIVQQGESIEVEVTLRNVRGWPIPWIFIEDYHPADFPRFGNNKQLGVLMPRRTMVLRYTLDCTRRGYHRIGPLLMESGDLFGLQKRFRSATVQDYVAVLPTIAYIDTFNIAAKRPQGPVRVSSRVYADPTRIKSIRDYVPGDPLNSIHWKATARSGALQVKYFEASSVQGGTLVLDLHEESYVPEHKEERLELAITTAASIAWLLQMSGEQVGLLTNGEDAALSAHYTVDEQQALMRAILDEALSAEESSGRISPLSVETLRSPVQAQQIAENLARILPGQGLDGYGLLMSGYNRLPRNASILLVAPLITERVALALAALQEGGFRVTVFLIKSAAAYDEAASLLAPHHIHVFHIEHEWSLHELSPDKIA